MKYQILTLINQKIPQGWSINIMRTERHYRVGNCIVTYSNKNIVYRLGDAKNMYGFVCYKNDRNEVYKTSINSWGLTLEKFRELFLMERMKANSKLGELL